MSADSSDTAKMDARPLLGELPTVSGGEPTDEDIAAGSEAQALLMEEQERQYAKKPLTRRIFEEFKQLIVLALPICCTFFLDSGMSLINTAFLGHIGARELAAGNLALVLTNTLGWSFGNGMLTAMDTLAAHAYGSGKKKRLGLLTQRTFWIMNGFCVPMSIVWLFAEPILKLVGQEPSICGICQEFIYFMIPGFFFAMWMECLARHLQAMEIAAPVSFCVAISLPVDAALLWLFIDVLELGMIGCPIAISVTYGVQFVCLLFYILGRRSELLPTWPGWTRKAVSCRGIWAFIKLAIPSAFMSCLEGWGFDIMTIFAGLLDTISLAAHGTLVNVYYFTYMIPLGVSVAGTTRIGLLLASRKPSRARLSYYVTYFFEIVIALGMFFGRVLVARIFTNDTQVVDMFGKISPFVAMVMVFDGLQIAGAGALRGLGRQTIGMIFNFIAFYLVGIPLGYVLAFVAHIQLAGLWVGLAASDSFSAVLMTVYLCCINWKKASNKIASEEEAAAAKAGLNASVKGSIQQPTPSSSYKSLMGPESGVNEYAATRVAAASVSSVRSLMHATFVPEDLSAGDDEDTGDDVDDDIDYDDIADGIADDDESPVTRSD